MYSGFRLKIEGNTISNMIISKGSYSVSTKDRIAESYTDAEQVDHVYTFGRKKTSIEFEIREHSNAEHAAIASLFSKLNNVNVEYYDDITDAYKTGVFRIDDVKFNHMFATKNKIMYAKTSVKLEEY